MSTRVEVPISFGLASKNGDDVMKKTICIDYVQHPDLDMTQGIYDVDPAGYADRLAGWTNKGGLELEQFVGGRLAVVERLATGMLKFEVELPQEANEQRLRQIRWKHVHAIADDAQMGTPRSTALQDRGFLLGEIDRLLGQVRMATGLYHAEQRKVLALQATLQAERHGRPPNPCPACGEEFLPVPAKEEKDGSTTSG